METTNKLKDIKEVLEFLYQEFPQCFKQKDGIKPLKVGIFKDIAERIEGSEKVSKTQVRQALRKYTSNWRYLEAVTKSDFRIDLDGNQGEKVEQEHIDHAQKALEESRAKLAKRKKQQRPRQDSEAKSFKKKPAHTAKSGDKRNTSSNKAATPAKRSGKVEPLPASEVKVNNKVKVKLGQALVNAVITEVNKEEIHVELVTGMQVKTKADSLYII
ncbi:RNA chaperone ProQ [Pseudoalteromonas sp. MMG010]|uniref:RNA chaperone ProQ n=1 Tax=Pseudoalteromonas sp. MMG010 TaxID=2822685 RepID=UPI001B3A32A1|nr:RNA chaperone ProQ [Pseudoalteromonas sp. MMG010]MBQ4832467.1 RNA chaperone ProQ [Pseudoalteromonas sp. MMG010]